MSSLSCLPPDIITEICEVLLSSGRSSLIIFARVSKFFTPSALGTLYADIDLNFSAATVIWTIRLLHLLITQTTGSKICNYVRHVTVTAGDEALEKRHLKNCFPLILKLITISSNLRSLSWHAVQEPHSLLKNFRKVQKLNLQLYDCHLATLSPTLLKQLSRNSELQSLLLELPADSLTNQRGELSAEIMDLAKLAIEQPKLQTLIVRLLPEYFRGIPISVPALVQFLGESPDWLRPRHQRHEGDLESLKNLRIVGLNMSIMRPYISLKHGIFSTIPCSHLKLLELWSCGDCSAIFDCLSLTDIHLHLRILRIADDPKDGFRWLATREGIEACENFIIWLDKLEELALQGFCGTETAFITWHHRTLRKLTWIEIEDQISPIEKAAALRRIGNECPNLTSLTVSQHRSKLRTGYLVADTLASFSSLPQLKVVIGRYDGDTPVGEYGAWNITRSLISPGLRQLDITDVIHNPTDETPFVDVKQDNKFREQARRCSVHWRAYIDLVVQFQLVDVVHSPDGWVERDKTRLRKSMVAASESAETSSGSGRPENSSLNSIYGAAERTRLQAVAALQGLSQ